jgi:uncharacterized membrane protein YfcA
MINDLGSLSVGNMASIRLLAAVTGAFVMGGIVKGALGVGLPLVMVPLLSLVMPSPKAISLVVIPVFVSNIWQAYDSRISMQSVRRFAPLIAALVLSMLLTVPMTLAMSTATLNVMVAGSVITAIILMSVRPRFAIPARYEQASSLAVGALSGVMGGVSSLTGPIIISYLTALRLTREDFVATISVVYLFAAVPLYGSMAAYGRLGAAELLWSLAGLIPLAIGMAAGKLLRGRLNEVWFRHALLIFLSAVAVTLLLKAARSTAAPVSAHFLSWNHHV